MTIDELAAGKYISLTTFKRDGSAVATPVWVMRQGDRLFVITDADSGKAKRLRNSSRAEVAPCDMRGNLTGDSVSCTAVLLDDAGTATVQRMVDQKYGLLAKTLSLMGSIRRTLGHGQENRVGIEITLD